MYDFRRTFSVDSYQGPQVGVLGVSKATKVTQGQVSEVGPTGDGSYFMTINCLDCEESFLAPQLKIVPAFHAQNVVAKT